MIDRRFSSLTISISRACRRRPSISLEIPCFVLCETGGTFGSARSAVVITGKLQHERDHDRRNSRTKKRSRLTFYAFLISEGMHCRKCKAPIIPALKLFPARRAQLT